MKTVVIVQARIGSTRLPGKVLLPLNGHTVIGEVLTRCKKIPGVQVVCAIPDSAENNALAHEASKYCPVWRGSEKDVLKRYYDAATYWQADYVVRVTGDCPLICPELCGAVLSLIQRTGVDYASNIEPRTFPQGVDCEVFTMQCLEWAQDQAFPSDREHVTTWMRRANIKRANVSNPWPIEGRMTLDTEDDYKVIRAAFEQKLAA